ncbi:MAG: hypothetical protein C4542_09755 [Dehalococcoidia bacterium]|nr:MAG: hypothetical protein C4542_09755 [Dehalococcoidia bacterium]
MSDSLPKCSFCDERPRWFFVTKPFAEVSLCEEGLEATRYPGGVVACEDCAQLLEQKQLRDLGWRVMQALMQEAVAHGQPLPDPESSKTANLARYIANFVTSMDTARTPGQPLGLS